jgi:hypothetical protein
MADDKAIQFKEDLKSLFKNSGLKRKENDQYDGEEEYQGYNVYLVDPEDNEPFYQQSLAEILTEVFGAIGLK